MNNTMDVNEAAAFLRIHPVTASELASRGEIPGAKFGRSWVFDLQVLSDWRAKQIEEQTANRRRNLSNPIPKTKKKKGKRKHIPPILPFPSDLPSDDLQ